MKPKVLLVEDNDMCQEIVGEYISTLDVEFLVASDGIEALEIMAQHDIDLVLMDIMMPNMDGVETATKIRALDNAKKANVPIIAVTARNPETDKDIWYAVGFNDYASKPFSEGELLELVQRYI